MSGQKAKNSPKRRHLSRVDKVLLTTSAVAVIIPATLWYVDGKLQAAIIQSEGITTLSENLVDQNNSVKIRYELMKDNPKRWDDVELAEYAYYTYRFAHQYDRSSSTESLPNSVDGINAYMNLTQANSSVPNLDKLRDDYFAEWDLYQTLQDFLNLLLIFNGILMAYAVIVKTTAEYSK